VLFFGGIEKKVSKKDLIYSAIYYAHLVHKSPFVYKVYVAIFFYKDDVRFYSNIYSPFQVHTGSHTSNMLSYPQKVTASPGTLLLS
jgi:hypothetical protein